MLTIMVHARIKEDKLPEYLEMAALLTEETKGKRPGCISYSFNQSLESPTEFVLYEQWKSQEHLDNHIQELCKLLLVTADMRCPQKAHHIFKKQV